MNETQLTQPKDDNRSTGNPSNTSTVSVYMKDTMGAIFLGILASITLIGWMRAEARIHALMKQLQPT